MRLLFVIPFVLFYGACQAQEPPPAPARDPVLPNAQPVTALFRRLLAADSEQEQQALLSHKAPSTQAVLVEKLEEYRALPAIERERRLHLLDMRGYISQLQALNPADRASRLQSIPEKDRQAVKERLFIWDSLTAKQKAQVRLYDITKNLLLTPPMPPSPPGLPRSPQQARIDQIAERWISYPPDQRKEIVEYCRKIFDDDPEIPPVKLAPVHTASVQERNQIEQTVRKLRNLPASEREKCLNGFTRFVALPVAARAQFLNNLTVWKTLSPEARAALNTLTEHLPPLPPDFYNPPSPPDPAFPTAVQ